MIPLVQVQGIHAHYGQSHVLRGIDLDIRAGESIGLLGRNGMGKTTLIRTIMGHVASTNGRMAIRGLDCTKARPHQISRLGLAYVPEGRGIFPNLNVRENLEVAARPGYEGRNEWTYDRVLTAFPRLAERLNHGGQQLSGGEQQMLAIGRALMTNPDVLILDEATEGLAPLIIAEIWQIIQAVRTAGMATLIVDRNYRKVLAHTDRYIVIEKGVVVQQSDSAQPARQHDLLMSLLGV